METLTREQVRRLDQLAAEKYGIPGVVLMENAGRNVAEAVLSRLNGKKTAQQRKTVAVVCGGGNNGGDGYVAARHLHIYGVRVAVYHTGGPASITSDAAINRRIVDRMDLPQRNVLTAAQLYVAAQEWADATVLVDALLGTGFKGSMRGLMPAIIEQCNALQGPEIVSIDVPSGLDSNTGKPGKMVIRASQTVTFIAPKAGFSNPEAAQYLGQVVVSQIGAPAELLQML